MGFDSEQRFENLKNCWPQTSYISWMSSEFRDNWVSVIITTYQRADYIIQTVNSIYNQIYRPIELIIIDDGSEDNTEEILKEWINNLPVDPNFHCNYIHKKNSGAPAARNLALLHSSGEFIQEVGSDDLLHPQKIDLNIRFLKEYTDCQSAWSPLRRFNNSEEKELNYLLNYSDLNKIVSIRKRAPNLFEPQFLPSAALHRRNVFFSAGPWLESLKRWQDLEYQVRMAYCIKNYVEINTPLYFFRQHDGVRINSQYKQKIGIESGFLALEAITSTLKLLNYKNDKMHLEISNFYYSLAELSASYSLKGDLRKAINGALQNRKGIGFHFRLRVYQFVAILFGGKFANRLSKAYFKSRVHEPKP